MCTACALPILLTVLELLHSWKRTLLLVLNFDCATLVCKSYVALHVCCLMNIVGVLFRAFCPCFLSILLRCLFVESAFAMAVRLSSAMVMLFLRKRSSCSANWRSVLLQCSCRSVLHRCFPSFVLHISDMMYVGWVWGNSVGVIAGTSVVSLLGS